VEAQMSSDELPGDAFLPVLDEMMTSGLVTIEKVQALQHGTAKP
jgi:hypothetical protein